MTGSKVDQSLTRANTQERLLEYFTMVLARVPKEMYLDRAAPKENLESVDGGTAGPCSDDNTVHNSPLNYEVGYWVNGIPDGQERDALRAFNTAMVDLGWRTRDHGIPTSLYAYTDDGYAIVTLLNDVGGLSLGGSGPCFPAENAAVTTPEPTRIPHP